MEFTSTTTRDDLDCSGIYGIFYKDTVYVGSSKNVLTRRGEHRSALTRETHHNPGLQNVVRKHGVGSCEFRLLEEVPVSKLIQEEQRWKDYFDGAGLKTLNAGPCTENARRGVKQSKAERRKRSATRLGKDLPVKKIIRSYKAGASVRTLAIEHDVSHVVVTRLLQAEHVRIRNRKEAIRLRASQKALPLKTQRLIIKGYKDGKTMKSLASEFEMDRNKVGWVLSLHSVPARPPGVDIRKTTNRQDREIVRRWRAGETTKALGKEFSISAQTIHDILNRNGIVVGKRKRSTTESQERRIARRYVAGESADELGQAFGVSGHTIRVILDEQGVKRRSTAASIRLVMRRGIQKHAKAIARRYKRGEYICDLAPEFEVSPQLLRAILVERGVKIRPPGLIKV